MYVPAQRLDQSNLEDRSRQPKPEELIQFNRMRVMVVEPCLAKFPNKDSSGEAIPGQGSDKSSARDGAHRKKGKRVRRHTYADVRRAVPTLVGTRRHTLGWSPTWADVRWTGMPTGPDESRHSSAHVGARVPTGPLNASDYFDPVSFQMGLRGSGPGTSNQTDLCLKFKRICILAVLLGILIGVLQFRV
ncbi:hypothetical protein DFH07DRAFT_770811 [Mycena maculata]|uniref:Uncharacterized protein n=1 Tax=Mycena maculata TaxID=230809 RepID=A0AAD7JF83_9AGAR|nr:hypothetical protein DFH07DRAFT_770811 [Mycena maculata]